MAVGCERAANDAGSAAAFRRGFLAMLPLWAGAVPVGVAYGASAREAGLGAGETQLMSLIVFSAAAQAGAVASLAAEEPPALVVGTAIALNVQIVLVGTAVARAAPLAGWRRLATAWFLTEGAYGVAAATGLPRPAPVVGAGASMYLAWNVGTAVGALGGGVLPAGRALGLALVAPLTFLAVLVPLVRSRPAALTALVAAASALALARALPLGVAVLGAGVTGSAAGAWAARAASHRGGDPATGEQAP